MIIKHKPGSCHTLQRSQHCEKYRNFTRSPGVETVPFRKISTPGNQVKLRYFSQCKVKGLQIRLLKRQQWERRLATVQKSHPNILHKEVIKSKTCRINIP